MRAEDLQNTLRKIEAVAMLSCVSWKREGRDQAKEKLIEYFLEHKYGQDYYTPEDLREIFREMDAVGMLFPLDDTEMVDIYANWRDKHYKYWFEKWWGKCRRKKKNLTFFYFLLISI